MYKKLNKVQNICLYQKNDLFLYNIFSEHMDETQIFLFFSIFYFY